MIPGIKEDLLFRRLKDDPLGIAIDNAESQDLSNSEIQSLLTSEGAIEVDGSRASFNTSLTDEEVLVQQLMTQ